MGVGLLLDDGGDDRYEAEAFAQGAAAFGLGLLLDLGGQDSYRSWTLSQGLGGPIGLGLLADATGDDTYLAEPGTPAAEEEAGGDGPAPLYPTGDDPEGRSNASRSQGAAIGYRRLEGGAPLDLAGGIGLLLDGEGADSYQADVQAQGFGFWWGTGLLADGQGPDQYDLRALGQACAFFFGLGLLLEGGGDDRYNLRRPDGLLYLLGTGAEYGSGLLLEEGGDDQYVAPAAALGVGLANGLGLLLERSGADSYRAGSLLTLGHARSLDDDEQPVRRNGRTVGVFVDGGGVDSYSREDLAEVEPQPPNKPGNDRRWEQQSNPELFWEQGRGIDGEGWGGM